MLQFPRKLTSLPFSQKAPWPNSDTVRLPPHRCGSRHRRLDASLAQSNRNWLTRVTSYVSTSRHLSVERCVPGQLR